MPVSDGSGVRQLRLAGDLQVDISESEARWPGKVDSFPDVMFDDSIKINIKVMGRG